VAAAIHRGDWNHASLTPRLRALGEVAYKLSLDPRAVGPEDWASLGSVGLDQEGCLELAHIVGLFNHLTRLADGFGLRVDPATLAAAAGGRRLSRPGDAQATTGVFESSAARPLPGHRRHV
jgi:uncharacterized protein YciW